MQSCGMKTGRCWWWPSSWIVAGIRCADGQTLRNKCRRIRRKSCRRLRRLGRALKKQWANGWRAGKEIRKLLSLWVGYWVDEKVHCEGRDVGSWGQAANGTQLVQKNHERKKWKAKSEGGRSTASVTKGESGRQDPRAAWTEEIGAAAGAGGRPPKSGVGKRRCKGLVGGRPWRVPRSVNEASGGEGCTAAVRAAEVCDQGGRRKTGRRHTTAVRTDGGVRGTGTLRTQTAGWTLPYWAAKEEEEAARKVGKGAEGDAAAGAVRRERSKQSTELARKPGRADVRDGGRKKEEKYWGRGLGFYWGS